MSSSKDMLVSTTDGVLDIRTYSDINYLNNHDIRYASLFPPLKVFQKDDISLNYPELLLSSPFNSCTYPFISKKLIAEPFDKLQHLGYEEILANFFSKSVINDYNNDSIIKQMIVENRIYDLYTKLGLNYIVTDRPSVHKSNIALIIHIFYKENLPIITEYLKKGFICPVYITTTYDNYEYFKNYDYCKQPNV